MIGALADGRSVPKTGSEHDQIAVARQPRRDVHAVRPRFVRGGRTSQLPGTPSIDARPTFDVSLPLSVAWLVEDRRDDRPVAQHRQVRPSRDVVHRHHGFGRFPIARLYIGAADLVRRLDQRGNREINGQRDAQDGRCVDLCTADADCGADLICTGSHLGNVVGRWCAEPCTTMVGCGFDAVDPDSRICKRRCDTVDQKFELACTPPVGTKNLNEALSAAESATNCKSGFSLTSGGATYCSQPCVVDGDCTIGMSCAAGNQTCSGGASEPFKRCRRL